MLNIKEIALNVADSLRNKIDGISHMQSNQGLVAFAEALISAHKAELLKGVGEPVAYYDPDLDCGSAGISFDPLSDGIGLYTSDQVAAAIIKATKPLEDQRAKQNEPVAFTNSAQLGYVTSGQHQDIPLAMWSRNTSYSGADIPLYTSPPTAEQIANETAEAIAEYCRNQDHYCLATEIESGAWKEFKK